MKFLNLLFVAAAMAVGAPGVAFAAENSKIQMQGKEKLPDAMVVRMDEDGDAEYVVMSPEDAQRIKADLEKGEMSEGLKGDLTAKLAKNPSLVWNKIEPGQVVVDELDTIGSEKALFFWSWWGAPAFVPCAPVFPAFGFSWSFWFRPW